VIGRGDRPKANGHNGNVTQTSRPGAVRERDLYALLGVEPGATTDEITAAFRAKAKELHPDRAPGDREASEQFKALSRAYSTLTRPRARAAYDARHSTSTAPTPAPPPQPRREILGTPRAAWWAIVGGIVCVVAGLATMPVLLSMATSPDTLGRDVTLWIVVAKLVICGVILVGAGWWRLVTMGPRRARPG
jgi:hypothetical protein